MPLKVKKNEKEPFSDIGQPNEKIRGVVPRKTGKDEPIEEERSKEFEYGAEANFSTYVDGKLDDTTDFVDRKMRKAAGKSVAAMSKATGKLVAVLRAMKDEE